MTITKLTSREFAHHVSRAKRAADVGPVIIANRGRPAYVLLSHEAYRRLTHVGRSIRQLLHQPGAEDVEYDPPRLGGGIFRATKLT